MSFHICQAVRFQALQNACKQSEKKIKSAIDHQKYSRLANGVQNHQHRSWHYVCIPAMMRRAFCWICHTEFDPLKVWLKGLLQIDLSHSKINRKGTANITKQSKLTLTVKFLHAFGNDACTVLPTNCTSFSQKERNLCKSNYMYIGIRVTIVINLSQYGEIPSMQQVIT